MAKLKAITKVEFHADENGCLGRHAFAGAVNAAWKRDTAIALLQLDLDGVHALNERAGRDVADHAIKATIGVVSRAAREESWTLGQLGGDEFALLAPGVTLEKAFMRAERLREDVDAALAAAIPESERCTVSIGVASSPRDAKSPDELLRKADLALYAAKEQGGDTVGLTPGDDMVLRSSYYTAAQLGRLRALAERLKKKEAVLLREALDDLLVKHDRS